MYSNKTLIKSQIQIKENGYTLFHKFFKNSFCESIHDELELSYKKCREIQVKNGLKNTNGTSHHLLACEQKLYLELLNKITESSLYDFIFEYFQGNFILNSFGGFKNLKDDPSYVTQIHRDIRFFVPNINIQLNMLIMLDDFTIENGATFLLPNSHLVDSKPNKDFFYKNSIRATGEKGDVLFFNSNLWHAAGVNTTYEERRAITISFSKPFMKQQMDYPRVIGYEKIKNFNKKTQQLLGYFSRTPQNLEEWYQKPNKRFYRKDQD